MFVKHSVKWSRVAIGACGSVAGSVMAAGLLAVVPVSSAHAQSTSCAAAWSAGTVYTAGDTASENGINYLANWWTRGDDPATHNGGSGSGQPWTSQGSCTGSSGGGDGGGGDSGGGNGGGTGTPPANPPADNFIFSPYKDVTINLNWNTNIMSTKVTGSAIPVVGSGGLTPGVLPNLHAITLAFATGACGSESWGGVSADAFANANIGTLDSNNINYVVSTGGQAGTFTCSSPSGMVQFIQRYLTPHMLGVDFDIEGGQNQQQINDLVNAVAYAENQYPTLRFSFTLATLAASDGSYGGVNSLGNEVIQAIQAAGLQHYTINLMTMDYGSAGSGVCVVSNGQCEMGQSTIQAVNNLEHTYGITPDHIEVTPMIGRNDVSSEIFTAADVDTVSTYAINQGLAGVHFWSLDRDTPCSGSTDYASPTCNSVSGTSQLQYTKRFLTDLGQ
ncbi:carbohydrate-binding protein [Oleiagrimonas sp. C23AA]|uniref:carbohydrate-binding protein n=1 Tax=Oleiagrimonas sp. C23AA TaxID=2719047 RepID=UPI0014246463|nr:carbohydrate-binding protein [Oleiagrimonas sp. C23AA]NII09437.1 carbohydrate-binding protein [Oleiagrimonas sp. C23AA]